VEGLGVTSAQSGLVWLEAFYTLFGWKATKEVID